MAGTTSISPMSPSDNGSLVSRYTSHSTTTNCIAQANTSPNLSAKNILNWGIRRASYGSLELMFSVREGMDEGAEHSCW